MARDRYERKHRRTRRHPEAVAFMASADFDAVPPLAEAMGLTEGTTKTVWHRWYAWVIRTGLTARNPKYGRLYDRLCRSPMGRRMW